MEAILVALPKKIEDYSQRFPCKSSEEMVQTLKIIAPKMAKIYANFLTAEGHRETQLKFQGIPTVFPSQEKVSLFENKLAEKIISILTEGSELEERRITLSTDYVPEKQLSDVLEDCDILPHDRSLQYAKYFPLKISAYIALKTQPTEIRVNINPI